MSPATDGSGDHADVGLLSPATVGTVAESLTSDREVAAAMVAFEAALRRALVRHELAPRGGFPADVADVVDVRGVARDAVAPGNPTVPLVAALRTRVGDAEQAGWVHHGATSQDVVDSALMVVATAVLQQVDDDLTLLAARLADLAVTHRDVVCVARTLTQQAMPTTLGFRVAGWLAGVQDALVTVRAVRPLPVSLGGPVGTLAAYGDAGPAVLDLVAHELGLAAPVVSWHGRRTPVLGLAAALVAVGEACGRIAADVLLMAQTEVGEATDGSGGASSAMAHKSNPTRSVLVATAARQLPPLLATVAACGAGASEQPAGDWHAEWAPLRTMLRLAGAAAERTRDLSADLVFDRGALRRNLDLLVGALGADDDWVATQTAPAGPWVDRVVKRQGDRAVSVDLAHRVDGPAGAPVVVLGPSLGTTWEMWDDVASALSASYQVVRYDTRGHGRSPVPDGPYSVDDLADDVLALVGSLGVGRFAMVGLSIGGAVAQTIAIREPSRLTAAVLCCTVPSFGGPASWAERAATVRASGTAAIAEATRGRWFTDAFRAAHPDEVERHIAMLTATAPEGYAGCCAALGGFDVTGSLGAITAPVRVVAGESDPVARVEACRALAAAVTDADVVVVPGTSHIATVAGTPFLAAVGEHLDRTVGGGS